MTLTSPSRLTHAEITPLAGGVEEPGVIMRSANAVEGAASATAAKTTKDRKELVSIFFPPSLRELRSCWQGLARRVNDTRCRSGRGNGVSGERVRGVRTPTFVDPSARQFSSDARKIDKRLAASGGCENGERSVLHAAEDLVLPSFADQPIVLPRFVEAQIGEVPHEQQHEDDRDVVGDRHDRPEVQERAHGGTSTRAGDGWSTCGNLPHEWAGCLTGRER